MAMKMTLAGMALGVAVCASTAMAQNGGMNSGAQQQPGGAQQNGMNQPGGMNSMNKMNQGATASMQDKMFLRDATQGSNFEIKTAQLAMQKSSSDDVKQFAQMMITDHTKLNQDMQPVAQQAGVTPPTGISKKDKATYARLSGLSGNAFDQAYIKTMCKDHTADLKAFKMEANNGQLASEKQAAQQGAGVVSMHLQHAEDLAKAHNVTASGM
jgi:putative membrane protein